MQAAKISSKMQASSAVLFLPLLVLVGVSACSPSEKPSSSAKPVAQTSSSTLQANYVGASTCAQCHEQQMQAWRGSNHDLALQQANSDTVLAETPSEFGDLAISGTGKELAIKPDADTEERKVHYTFGVEPLQQYVIEAEPGRLQVLPTPWDTHEADEGGQRWYELYPGDFPADDPMHWRGRANSWNAMCADCHSTGVEKGYDAATRTYHTTFKEEDVACEACHGPGSRHVEAARFGQPIDGLLTDISNQQEQINVCAQCHSRRAQLREGFKPGQSLFDYYEPSLLREGLYHADGQILDEVYVYGSFLQSRMHLQGVTCSNCHDPHSALLKFDGNTVCTQCHNAATRPDFPTLKPANYDDPEHHFHAKDSPGAACVNCHMPAATYMGVDVRYDHSFRLPRPDLSERLGVPNTCNSCHTDRSAAWANETIETRYGERPDHYGEVFAAARSGDVGAEASLVALAADENVPVMVRATAVSLLSNIPSGESVAILDTLWRAKDGHPLLRLGATLGVAALSPQRQWQLVSPLLEDEYLAIRSAAFSALLSVASDPELGPRLRPYLPAFVDSQSQNLDWPETQVNLANAHIAFGDPYAAEYALREALVLQPSFVPAMLNLADLYRATERDEDAEELLVRAMQAAPDAAAPAFSYAMWLTRQQQSTAALDYFQRAAEFEPDHLRYSYTLAVALHDSGRGADAVDKLTSLHKRWPANYDLLYALVLMLKDQGRNAEALQRLDQLLEIVPENRSLQELRKQLSN